jgi:hypothetical protein
MSFLRVEFEIIKGRIKGKIEEKRAHQSIPSPPKTLLVSTNIISFLQTMNFPI